jgi:hypothetical protein
VRGFDRTQPGSVTAEIGEPGRIEGAAGSRFISIPVTIRATTTRGDLQCYHGLYALRRTVVDGASEAQRTWHLFSGDLQSCADAPTDQKRPPSAAGFWLTRAHVDLIQSYLHDAEQA